MFKPGECFRLHMLRIKWIPSHVRLVRTASSCTLSSVHTVSLVLSPLCSSCSVTANIDNFIASCSKHNLQWANFFRDGQRLGGPNAATGGVVFPRAHWIVWRDASSLLLELLRGISDDLGFSSSLCLMWSDVVKAQQLPAVPCKAKFTSA